MKIVEKYLPKKASRDEMESFIVTHLSQTEERQFGVLMKEVLAHFGQAADGKTISQIIKEKLNS